ncbi:hypothetical protein JCM30204_16920 [Dysgonomonas termitidis]
MEKRNKLWRIGQRDRLYAAKMKLEASYGGSFILDGEITCNPRWIELYKANWNPVYKSVRTACSCPVCRGERYNRCQYKWETGRIIEGNL